MGTEQLELNCENIRSWKAPAFKTRLADSTIAPPPQPPPPQRFPLTNVSWLLDTSEDATKEIIFVRLFLFFVQ